jgi:hypothetical protein
MKCLTRRAGAMRHKPLVNVAGYAEIVTSGHVALAERHLEHGDVQVVERGEDLGFALKAAEYIRLRVHRGREHFEGDLALQIGIDCPIHLPCRRPRSVRVSDSGRIECQQQGSQ